MSQHNDEHSYLTGRIIDLLAERYGFREHWEVSLSNNIARGTVSVAVTLLQHPDRHLSGDVRSGFDIAGWLFPEFSVVSDRVLVAARQIIDSLRYRNQQANHPPQVKIYCWLEENSLERRDQYVTPDYRPEPAFSNSIHLHVLLQDLLRCACEDPIRVYPTEVRIGRRGDPSEMVFHSPRELSHTVAQLLTQRQLQSAPTVSSQHRSHIRRVEL